MDGCTLQNCFMITRNREGCCRDGIVKVIVNRDVVKKKGWSGFQSFPRSVWLSDTRKQLWPVDKIEKLRTKQVNITKRELKGGTILEIPSITASHADIEVSFSLSNLKESELINSEMREFQSLLVLASNNFRERTVVFFQVFKGPNKFLVLMCSDQSRSSIAQEVDKSIYGAFLDLDPRNNIPLRTLIEDTTNRQNGKGKT
ncbi:LOW QUALITY PROTEIN: hypothetical protein OSB04_030133 [Centaurea solstitialis]|uniref:Uncharacterized protein n=1 Tax=Centaurea solstitialis TaxID=347529 RepID=A0AA38SJM4_9ASTR|nr:LOW QUALITY PROTEIN: hypothetical protein OSB04_030133 [Centaurea solstitialis]